MENFISKILSFSNSNNNALIIKDKNYTYKKFISDSLKMAAYYQSMDVERVAIETKKEYATYVYILGAILAKVSYVPIGTTLPEQRKENIKQRAKINFSPQIDLLQEYLTLDPLQYQSHQFTDEVYLLFTSGSTGTPKGVPIYFKQLNSYIHNINHEIDFSNLKRFSHMFELTFDLSVHDLFITWFNGATLCVPTNEELYFPTHYIQKHEIDCWFSVPTLAANMINMGTINKDSLKSLKLSLFCGEALPFNIANTWFDNSESKIINLYGPTEATIAFTIKEFNSNEEEKIVSIGRPFKGLEVDITEQGELVLIGDQVTNGYLDSPKKTKESFFIKNKKNAYLTGDLVEYKNELLCFKGRKDFQVQINGHRVELQEIEYHLQNITKNNQLICAVEPFGEVNASSISIISTQKIENLKELQNQLTQFLPKYMIPNKCYFIDQLPTNSSGKTDRKQAIKLIKS